MRVKCLHAQEHNTMSPRARTQTARSGDERTGGQVHRLKNNLVEASAYDGDAVKKEITNRNRKSSPCILLIDFLESKSLSHIWR